MSYAQCFGFIGDGLELMHRREAQTQMLRLHIIRPCITFLLFTTAAQCLARSAIRPLYSE